MLLSEVGSKLIEVGNEREPGVRIEMKLLTGMRAMYTFHFKKQTEAYVLNLLDNTLTILHTPVNYQ